MSSPPTLLRYLEQQDALVAEASEVLPHSFNACTYALGPIRQAVYLCLTCTPEDASPAGVCAACSIACHADHEQLELFPKRNFVCDCSTEGVPSKCTLRQHKELKNEGNSYGQNFRGRFCRCKRTYDAAKERETMVQCAACEDWFHESCLNLRERPPSRDPSPVDPPASTSSNIDTPRPPFTSTEDTPAESASETDDDAASETSSDDLPPALLPGTSYDTLICGSCVRSIPPLRTIAGTPGALVVFRDNLDAPWRVVDADVNQAEATLDVMDAPEDDPLSGDVRRLESEQTIGTKRALSPDGLADIPPKRARGDTSLSTASVEDSTIPVKTVCVAPSPIPNIQAIYDGLDKTNEISTFTSTLESAGDVFLTEGWRERWCQCSSCLPALAMRPYLLEEEETYEPPEDPDAGLSLEELGMRALAKLPRDKAIDGLVAFRDMQDDLLKYLRPFAEQGRVVQAADVTNFFEERREARQTR